MKKYKIIWYLIIGIFTNLNAQNSYAQWLSSPYNVNVNDPSYFNPGRIDALNATVKLKFFKKTTKMYTRIGTGTLLNRNTTDGEVGYYILTANHVLASGANSLGVVIPGMIEDVDLDTTQFIIFNYQSSNANNNSTPISNIGGIKSKQSEKLIDQGYEYVHATKIRLVDRFLWGDFALFEMLTPVPPHFNVCFAGWSPSRVDNVFNITGSPTEIVGFHHPKGELKKITGINSFFNYDSPIATGCYTITTVLDYIFGWIWGHSISTKVVCNYVDNPWINVTSLQYGTLEEGSSGSGIFNNNNKLFGVLSGNTISAYTFPINQPYGKFRSNYFNASIKNTLNPSNDFWVDQWGIGSRKISVYDNLVLPGGDGIKPGYYFPANHYQSENKIVLSARNNIETTQPIIIFNGADYEFVAGNRIILRPGFTVDSGATFKGKIGLPQNISKPKNSTQDMLLEKLSKIQLTPSADNRMKINPQVNFGFKVFPNPTSGTINIDFENNFNEFSDYELCDLTGSILLKSRIKNNIEKVNVENFVSGMYLLKIKHKNNSYDYKKIILN